MRWDLSAFADKRIAGYSLLELTTYSVQRLSDELKDFGQVRVVEILAGDPNWNQQTVTYNSLCQGQLIDNVLNPQMIMDSKINEGRKGQTLISISQPVLQRMIENKTLGLALRPLGVINASFYTMENQGGRFSANLYFHQRK